MDLPTHSNRTSSTIWRVSVSGSIASSKRHDYWPLGCAPCSYCHCLAMIAFCASDCHWSLHHCHSGCDHDAVDCNCECEYLRGCPLLRTYGNCHSVVVRGPSAENMVVPRKSAALWSDGHAHDVYGISPNRCRHCPDAVCGTHAGSLQVQLWLRLNIVISIHCQMLAQNENTFRRFSNIGRYGRIL